MDLHHERTPPGLGAALHLGDKLLGIVTGEVEADCRDADAGALELGRKRHCGGNICAIGDRHVGNGEAGRFSRGTGGRTRCHIHWLSPFTIVSVVTLSRSR